MQTDYQLATSSAVCFDLSNRSKIQLAGPDALLFLHNLCTSDVKNLAVGSGAEAFLTTAKAKVVAHVLVGHFTGPGGNFVLLDFVPGESAKVLRHLDHLLISEQVELADRTQELALFRVAGPDADAVFEQFGASVRSLPHLHHVSAEIAGAAVYLRRHELLRVPAVDVFCDAAHADSVRAALNVAGVQTGSLETHELLRIESGLPEYGQDIDENRMVVEVGRIKQAICYTKGCFLGQEPIVMARDRGQVNRTLRQLQIAGNEPVVRGAKLLHGADEVGQITSAAWSPRAQCIVALAYVKRGHQGAGEELSVDGRKASIADVSSSA